MKMRVLQKQLLAFLLLLSFLVLTGFTYQKDKQRIYDNAGLFTKDEKEELENLFRDKSVEDEMDYILLTEDSPDVDDSREYAKAFYLEKGFGYDKEGGDGNLLFIDMGNRRVEMIDKGKCVDFIRDDEVEKILDEVTTHLSDGDYIEAAKSYVEETHFAFATDSDSQAEEYSYDDYHGSQTNKNSRMRYIVYGILAFILSGVVTGTLIMGNKSRMTTDFYTYGKDIHVNPMTRQDRYIRTVTTSTPKPKHNSDGGGGSMDSSGFGGGGRDF